MKVVELKMVYIVKRSRGIPRKVLGNELCRKLESCIAKEQAPSMAHGKPGDWISAPNSHSKLYGNLRKWLQYT